MRWYRNCYNKYWFYWACLISLRFSVQMYNTSEPKLHKSWTQQQSAGQCLWRGEEEAQKQLKFIIFFMLPSSCRINQQQRQQNLVAHVVGELNIQTKGLKSYSRCLKREGGNVCCMLLILCFSLVILRCPCNLFLLTDALRSSVHAQLHIFTHTQKRLLPFFANTSLDHLFSYFISLINVFRTMSLICILLIINKLNNRTNNNIKSSWEFLPLKPI